MSSSCTSFTQIPNPPTTLPSCSVPIGGSNSSILDACCNGHINPMATYSAPASESNAVSDDGCFQFCTTDSVASVQACLSAKLGAYRSEGIGAPYQCFNVDAAGATKDGRPGESGYGSSGVKRASVSWTLSLVLGLGFVGAVAGVA